MQREEYELAMDMCKRARSKYQAVQDTNWYVTSACNLGVTAVVKGAVSVGGDGHKVPRALL
jgi:formate-dependent phosphoribosylglycinamide formyltransferase (GAR transformylase)